MLQGFGDQKSIKFLNEAGETVGTSQKSNLQVLPRLEINQQTLNILKKKHPFLKKIVTVREKSCLFLKKIFDSIGGLIRQIIAQYKCIIDLIHKVGIILFKVKAQVKRVQSGQGHS